MIRSKILATALLAIMASGTMATESNAAGVRYCKAYARDMQTTGLVLRRSLAALLAAPWQAASLVPSLAENMPCAPASLPAV